MGDVNATVDPQTDNQQQAADTGTEEGDFLTGQTSNAETEPSSKDTQSTSGEPQDTEEGGEARAEPSKPKHPYMSQLGKDLWDNESLGKFEKVDKLARAYIELEGKLGKSVTLPGKDASEDEWSVFLTKLGRPENPEGYEFEEVEGLPPDLQFNEEKESDFKQTAHKLGLTQQQAKELQKWHVNSILSDYKGMVQKKADNYKNAVKTMKDEWGDEYSQNLELMRRGYDRLATPELKKSLRESGLTNDPHIIKLFSQVGKLYAEDQSMSGRERETAERDYATILYPQK